MNRIAAGAACAAAGAVIAFGVTYTLMQWEIDGLRAAALRSAAREENMSKQLSAALDISSKVEQQERELKRQLELALAAQTGNEELVKAVKDLTGKIKITPAKVQKPVEKPQVDAPSVPAPAPVKPAAPAPKEIEPQVVAGGVDPAEMVAAHNRWRNEVGVPNLKWSDKLATVAQGYADKLAAGGCKLPMQHSGSRYGENLYWHRASTAVLPSRPVDAWTENEKDWYDPATGQCSAPAGGFCGHYTQVVWKDTKEVGCGMAFCPGSGQVWVCNYSPAGNIVGRKPY